MKLLTFIFLLISYEILLSCVVSTTLAKLQLEKRKCGNSCKVNSKAVERIDVFNNNVVIKSKISALRKDPRPYSRCLHGVFVMNFGFTLTPTITLTIAPKEADTSPPPEQTNKQV